MTLKRAKLIAALIADLDKDCEHTDYVAKVMKNAYHENEYSVELSSMANHRNQICDLTCFARILELLGTKVHIYSAANYVEIS